MSIRSLVLALAGVLATTAGAQAGVLEKSGTMCGLFSSSFCGHTKQGSPSGFNPDPGVAWDDNTVDTLRPTAPLVQRGQLLIFLHGTGGDGMVGAGDPTTGQLGFYNIAITAGYHVIAPDWPDSDKANGTVCGCFRDCYGDWDWIRWMGGSKLGMRTIASADSISGRVRAIINNRIAADPSGNWSQYLDAAQDGGLAWNKIVVSGFSQGGNLALYLAKHEPLAKLIAFSAFDEELSSTNGSSHTDLTVYHYGTENGIGACTPAAKPNVNNCDQFDNSLLVAGYTADNNFQSFGGSNWRTPLSKIYALGDTYDDAAPWKTIHAGMCTIKLDTQNNGTDDYLNISNVNTNVATWNNADYHWLASSFGQTSSSQCGTPCSGSACGGHSQVIATTKCAPGTVGESKRLAAWRYMLND